MVNLEGLLNLVEKLRKETIGKPDWIESKKYYEYQNRSVITVAVLKLIRAAHGLSALNLLRNNGLFIDFGVAIRCISDSIYEIYFLLERFPETSTKVDRFVEYFFASTIDGYLSKTPTVDSSTIRNAKVRFLKGRHDQGTSDLIENLYKTFCGYVHTNYAHIMEVYNGHDDSFNLAGIQSEYQQQLRAEYIELMAKNIIYVMVFISFKLNLTTLYREICEAGYP